MVFTPLSAAYSVNFYSMINADRMFAVAAASRSLPMPFPVDAAAFARHLWEALDPDNRISLYVRTVRLADGAAENILINRYGEEA